MLKTLTQPEDSDKGLFVGQRARAAHAQELHDRLAALEMMLLQKPIVSGRYSGCIHKRFMLPLRPYYDFTLRRWASFHRPRGPACPSTRS